MRRMRVFDNGKKNTHAHTGRLRCRTIVIRRYTVTTFGTTIVFENSTHDCYFGVFSFVRPSCIFSPLFYDRLRRVQLRAARGEYFGVTSVPRLCRAIIDDAFVDAARPARRPHTPPSDLQNAASHRRSIGLRSWTTVASKTRTGPLLNLQCLKSEKSTRAHTKFTDWPP